MNKTRSVPNTILIVLTLSLSALIAIMGGIRIKISQTPVARRPVYDEEISPKVNEYLTKDFNGISSNPEYDARGNLVRGQSESYCKVLVSDYDEEYIYAYVVCQEYAWSYNYKIVSEMENTVEVTRSLIHGSGHSEHVRLKYQPGTDFEIVDHVSPRGGATYYSDLLDLFGKFERIGEPDMKERREIFEEIKERFRNKHDDWPERVTKLGELKNPEIIIGGEI